MTTIALITGSNRGLGLATARRLTACDMTVLVGARDATSGERAAATLRSEDLDAHAVTIDVTSPASVQAAARDVAGRYGRLDVLINNAGILPEAASPAGAEPSDLGMFKKTFETNLFGVVSVIGAFLPLLRMSAAGRIVNVSSTMGSLTDQCDPTSPYYGLVVPAYQTSKAALNGITVALAKLLEDTPIKVNSVCPGWVQTDLGGPDNRAAAPLTAEDASRIVADMAMVTDDGPAGQFFDTAGAVAW